MAETVEELVVKATPEGIDETTDGLQGMQDQFEETADEMGETTSVLEDLQQRFAGAFGAITAGLAVAVGGLLTQVPVIGEVASGVGAIVDSLARRIDKNLRPVLQPIADGFFKIAKKIDEADGPLGKFLDTAIIFTGLVGGFVVGIYALSTAMAALSAASLPVSLPVLAVVAAFAALIAIWQTDFLNIKTKVKDALETLETKTDDFVDALGGIAEWSLGGVKDLLNDLKEAINNPKDAANDLYFFLVGIKNWTLGGAKDVLNTVKSILKDAAGFAGDILTDLGEIGKKTAKATVKFLTGAGKKALGIAGDISDALVDIGEGAYEAAINFADDPFGTITQIGSELVGITKDPYKAVVNIVTELKNNLPEIDVSTDQGRGGGSQIGMTGTNTPSRVDPNLNVDGDTMNSALSQYDTSYTSDGGR